MAPAHDGSEHMLGISRDARLMIGITLITIPTIVYGGLTVLGVVTSGAAGAPGPEALTPLQMALYRAGHAHAGVRSRQAMTTSL